MNLLAAMRATFPVERSESQTSAVAPAAIGFVRLCVRWVGNAEVAVNIDRAGQHYEDPQILPPVERRRG